jgi:hypothetical protein
MKIKNIIFMLIGCTIVATIIWKIGAIKMHLKDGENSIRLYTCDECQIPSDIQELKSEDSRCISLGFQNVTVTELKKYV